MHNARPDPNGIRLGDRLWGLMPELRRLDAFLATDSVEIAARDRDLQEAVAGFVIPFMTDRAQLEQPRAQTPECRCDRDFAFDQIGVADLGQCLP